MTIRFRLSLAAKSMSPDPRVRQIYERRFDDKARRDKHAVWKVLVEDCLQRFVDPTDTVLDVGCGFGEFLNHVRCARRIGVDLNSESGAALDEGIEFFRDDATELTMIPDQTVNLVFTSNFMEHLPGKEAVQRMIDEVRRVLVPEEIERALRDLEYEIIVSYDSEEDTTLSAIEQLGRKPKRLRLVRNQLGPSPSLAIRAGLSWRSAPAERSAGSRSWQ